MAKLAMMYHDKFRISPSSVVDRAEGRRQRIATSAAVCALLAFGLSASAIAEGTKPGVIKSAVPAGVKSAVPAGVKGAVPAGVKSAVPAGVKPGAAESAGSCSAPLPVAGQRLGSGPSSGLSSGNLQELLERMTAGTDGARARLRELPVREISQGVLADQVLHQNLSIQSSAEGLAIAKAVVSQSDSVFDPTLFSSLTYTNRYGNPRRDYITRYRDQNPGSKLDEEDRRRKAQISGEDTADTQGSFDCLPIVTADGITPPAVPGCQLPPLISLQREDASYVSISDHKATGSLGAGLNFIFGGSASISVSSTWHKPGAMAGTAPAMTDAAYPTGLTFDPYGWNTKLFWTSAASLSLSMPLPFTKNFGFEGNPGYYSYQIAQTSERRAAWSDKSVHNASLEQALASYWDAAQAVQSLRTLINLRAVLGERMSSQKRLFDAGLATNYDLAQLTAQQASLDAREETSWNQLLIASGRLGTLIAGDQRALMLPSDVEAMLGAPASIDQGDVPEVERLYDRTLDFHPDIKAQEEDYGATKLALDFRENQDLPDLSLSASLSVGQTDSVFGYPGINQSLAHLIRPDNSNLFIGLRYHLPIGMNGTESAHDRARIEERQAFDRTRQVRQRVVGALDRAIGSARSTQALVRQSGNDLRLAQCAYDLARDQRDLGLVAEFEVLNKYQDLVNSRLGLITAQVNFRKAHVHLLAAQGTLEQDYVR
ncbi:MAG: TolC family protein [Rhodospirillaceae bacterium]